MEIAKEFTAMAAMLEPATFFSAQLMLHTVIVHEAAFIRKTRMVSILNHFILALIIELKRLAKGSVILNIADSLKWVLSFPLSGSAH